MIQNAKNNFPIKDLKELGFTVKEVDENIEKYCEYKLQLTKHIRLEVTKSYDKIGNKYFFHSDRVEIGVGDNNKVHEWATLPIENIEKLKQFLTALTLKK